MCPSYQSVTPSAAETPFEQKVLSDNKFLGRVVVQLLQLNGKFSLCVAVILKPPQNNLAETETTKPNHFQRHAITANFVLKHCPSHPQSRHSL